MKTAEKGRPGRFKKALIVVSNIVILVLLIGLMDLYGFLIYLLAMVLYRMWKQRSHIIMAYTYLETILFGKPLSRKYWRKGEFKNRPKRIAWTKWRVKKHETASKSDKKNQGERQSNQRVQKTIQRTL